MRERVMAAADELGYRPNAIARGLITQQSNMVAVIITQQTNLYYPEVLFQLTSRFSERGIRVLLFTLEHEADIDSMIEQILQYRVDGIVTAALLSRHQLDTLENAKIPVIFFNRTLSEVLVNSVRCDQEEGERWLVSELYDAGHRSYAIVTGPEDSPVSAERTTGALRKLEELGVSDITIVHGDFSSASGRTAFGDLMEVRGSSPDAVIAANDAMAIGVVDGARQDFALSVPEEVSVVGFDGVGPARFAAYDITTVRQPIGRMTEAAVSMLLNRIEDPSLSPEKRVFSGERVPGGLALLAGGDR
jgi:DNA-binding LacI/PurR family transcriptional regulator